MEKTKFDDVSSQELENTVGGRRHSSSWQKKVGEFWDGFLHGWVAISNNNEKGSN